MTEIKTTKIPRRQKCVDKDHPYIGGSVDIIDDNKNKTQEQINSDVDDKFTQLDNEIEALEKQDVIPVDTLPGVADADPKKIYRVVGEDSYTDYMVNASGDGWKTLATYSFPGIDDEPTAGSEHLVKSGGVATKINTLDLEVFGEKIDNASITSNVESNKIINPNGTITNYNNFVVSKKYSAENLKKISFRGYEGSVWRAFAFFDENDNYIVDGRTLPSSSQLIEVEFTNIPDGASYVRFCEATDYLGDWSAALLYQKEGLSDKVKDLTENIDNINYIVDGERNEDVSFSEEGTENNKIINPNGSISAYNGFIVSKKYSVENLVAVSYKGHESSVWRGFAFYDENDNYVPDGRTLPSSTTLVEEEFTNIPNGAAYVRFCDATDYLSYFSTSLFYKDNAIIEKMDDLYGTDTPIVKNASLTTADVQEYINRRNNQREPYSNIYTSVPYCLENLISITGTQYIGNGNLIYYYAFLDENGICIGGNDIPETSGAKDINILPSDIPSGAKFICFTDGSDDLASFDIIISYNNVGRVNILEGKVEELENEIHNSKWKDKDVLMFGDSFVDYDNYPNAVASLFGCNIINRGIGGSVVRRLDGDPHGSLICRMEGYAGQPSTGKAAPLPDTCDLVIIQGGLNDWTQNDILGTIDEGISEDTHFYSALHYLLKSLREKYPSTPIIYGTPIHYNGSSSDFVIDAQTGEYSLVKNTRNNTLNEYVQAIKEVCAVWSVPVVDFWSDSGIVPEIESNKNLYTADTYGVPDGCHPSAAGAAKMALLVKKVVDYI